MGLPSQSPITTSLLMASSFRRGAHSPDRSTWAVAGDTSTRSASAAMETHSGFRVMVSSVALRRRTTAAAIGAKAPRLAGLVNGFTGTSPPAEPILRTTERDHAYPIVF